MTIKQQVGKVLIPRLPVNRRTFDVLRFELTAIVLQIKNALNPAYHKKIKELRSIREISLNVGSGGQGIAGWINTDVRKYKDTDLCLDIRKKLPFADGSVRRIFAEHVMEHIDFMYDIPGALREFHRILAPGGVLRIIVPDTERFIQAYAGGDAAAWQALGWDLSHMPDDIYTRMHILNHIFSQSGEHLFAYDPETLGYALKKAGFTGIHKNDYKRSIDEKLNLDAESHSMHSLYVDAVK